jgi:prevent-host-death family protein
MRVPRVGVRELKNRTSEIVRAVRERGVRYIVTHQGRPVGLLLPVDEESLDAAVRQAVEGATGAGGVQAPTGDLPSLAPEEILHLARQVYADLSTEEIEAVEAIALDRSRLARPEP